jgi:hypothetical protein
MQVIVTRQAERLQVAQCCCLVGWRWGKSTPPLEPWNVNSQLNFESIMKSWTEQGDATLTPRRQASAHTFALTAIFTLLVLFAGIDIICPSFKHQLLLRTDNHLQAGVVSPAYESFEWAQVCIAKSLRTSHLLRYASLATKSLFGK